MQEALLYILTFFSPRLQPYVKMFNYENGAVHTDDNYIPAFTAVEVLSFRGQCRKIKREETLMIVEFLMRR